MHGKARKAEFLRKCYWICLLCLTMAAAASSANAQNSVNVTATAGSVTPDWALVPTDPSNPCVASLGATVTNPPTAPYPSCPIQGPTWSWNQAVGANYSADNVMWTSPPSNSYSAWIVQPYTTSPAATLNVLYYAGGYWQFNCNVSVRYNDGGCGNTWVGAASAKAAGRAVQLVSLTVISGATQTNVTGATNWAAVKQAGATVIAQATTAPNNADGWSKIEWSGGNSGATANQRSVDRGTSEKTTVTAKIGQVSLSVNAWILWVTITNQITGTTPPNAVQFGTRYDGTENLGAIAYNGGTIAVGKIVPIGKITPAGVHDVVKAGWKFRRRRMSHDFNDGAKDAKYFDSDWQDDTSDPAFQVLTPDANDQIYDRDAPNIAAFGNKDSSETYNNFGEYVQWNDAWASDYQGWYWKGWWKATENPQITLKEIGQGSITLPGSSHYPPP